MQYQRGKTRVYICLLNKFVEPKSSFFVLPSLMFYNASRTNTWFNAEEAPGRLKSLLYYKYI